MYFVFFSLTQSWETRSQLFSACVPSTTKVCLFNTVLLSQRDGAAEVTGGHVGGLTDASFYCGCQFVACKSIPNAPKSLTTAASITFYCLGRKKILICRKIWYQIFCIFPPEAKVCPLQDCYSGVLTHIQHKTINSKLSLKTAKCSATEQIWTAFSIFPPVSGIKPRIWVWSYWFAPLGLIFCECWDLCGRTEVQVKIPNHYSSHVFWQYVLGNVKKGNVCP